MLQTNLLAHGHADLVSRTRLCREYWMQLIPDVVYDFYGERRELQLKSTSTSSTYQTPNARSAILQ